MSVSVSTHQSSLCVTCSVEGRHGAEREGSAESARQRGGRRLALTRTLMATDELGEVGGRGRDEGVRQVGKEQRRLAAEGRGCRVTRKVSATQEQCDTEGP